MDAQLEARLTQILDALAEHQPAERILAQVSDGGEIVSYLHVVLALQSLAAPAQVVGEDASRRAMIARASAVRPAVRPAWTMPAIVRAFAVLILVFGLAGLIVRQAQAALPSSPLYGVKRTLEDVQMLLTSGPSARANMAARFEQERQREVRALLLGGGDADAEFSGVIEAIQPDRWVVSGITIYVTQGSTIEGTPAAGAEVRATGRIIGGSFIAYRLVIETADTMPPAGPTATQTPTTAPPQFSQSIVPTHTPRPQPEEAIEPTTQAPPQPPLVQPSATLSGLGDPDQDDGGGLQNDNCAGDQQGDVCEPTEESTSGGSGQDDNSGGNDNDDDSSDGDGGSDGGGSDGF